MFFCRRRAGACISGGPHIAALIGDNGAFLALGADGRLHGMWGKDEALPARLHGDRTVPPGIVGVAATTSAWVPLLADGTLLSPFGSRKLGGELNSPTVELLAGHPCAPPAGAGLGNGCGSPPQLA